MNTVHSTERHPDIGATRAGYGRASHSVSMRIPYGLTLLTAL
jgi:hypothetical protein